MKCQFLCVRNVDYGVVYCISCIQKTIKKRRFAEKKNLALTTNFLDNTLQRKCIIIDTSAIDIFVKYDNNYL